MSIFGSFLLVIICVCGLYSYESQQRTFHPTSLSVLPEAQTTFITVENLERVDTFYFASCWWHELFRVIGLRLKVHFVYILFASGGPNLHKTIISTLSGSTRDNYLILSFSRPGDHNQARKLILLKSQTVHDINNSVLIIQLLVGHLSLVRAKNILHNSTEFVTTDNHW